MILVHSNKKKFLTETLVLIDECLFLALTIVYVGITTIKRDTVYIFTTKDCREFGRNKGSFEITKVSCENSKFISSHFTQ